MSKLDFNHFYILRVLGEALHRAGEVMTSSRLLSDASALLFSAKSFAAAMLAYYLALSIGLERPSWAIITVYIVSQTSVGASLSKSLYRLVGTLIGAGATVLIVPAFVNMPVLCSVVLAGWICLCLYFSLLERTPRAYAFLLAGYTASLIGFPEVQHPGEIFDTAIARVQEIVIGIICAGVMHRYVLPKRISGLFNSKMAETLRDARRMLANALTNPPQLASGDLRMASALQFLQGVSHHVPYDFALSIPVRNARNRLHDKLARLLVVSSELRDGVQRIVAMPAPLLELRDEVTNWLGVEQASERRLAGDMLQQRSAALTAQLAADAQGFDDELAVSFCRYLNEAVSLLLQCERLFAALHQTAFNTSEKRTKSAKGYVYHRDSLSAARTSLGAFTIILSSCLLWIYSAWPDGGTAVSVIGVCCTLFGNFDTPAPHIGKYMLGSAYGVMLSLLYSFALLPQVTEFCVLVAVLAPAYLLAGSLQARPQTTFMAMGITLTLPILSELGFQYSADFTSALNTAIALFAGTGFAFVSMSLLQTVQADAAINRLLRICRSDIRRSVKGIFARDELYWTNLMMDRTALLLPRLSRSEQSSEQILSQMLHYLRLGLAARQLRRLMPQLENKTASEVNQLLGQLAHEKRPDALRPRIESMINLYSPTQSETAHRLIGGLVALHGALQEAPQEQVDD
ncbi:FUSC family protein [Ewingella americana]|uniref:Putative membrane protein n=1 Tax=Ewingella americana (strain ATCC 33852 / DSM 4580 / CCUG 14506 / JCM 5911 / LMG 7869 / NCTC 12157 / CDC 1468-78) TaxID=910964 RepID=A0A085G1L5_EWIA3|nr:FUSC family protein [Ewingella americana]KFC77610.1 putative membrane protein [Ewingella americana ATCC 33852]